MAKNKEDADNPRAFSIDTVEWDGHALTCVSIEAELSNRNNPVVCPPDWAERIAVPMDSADIVFMPYFPPEIARNVYHVPVLGRLASKYAERYHTVYRTTVNMAAERGKQVAAADIANSVVYLVHELGLLNAMFIISAKGPANPRITAVEQKIPTATDARRVFTARAIRQLARERGENTSFLYVAAPAHAKRVMKYVVQSPTEQDNRRFERYQRVYKYADRRVRVYDFANGGWTLAEAKNIQ